MNEFAKAVMTKIARNEQWQIASTENRKFTLLYTSEASE